MGLLGGLIKTAVNIATLPVSAAVDILTAGEDNLTEKNLKAVGESVSEVAKDTSDIIDKVV